MIIKVPNHNLKLISFGGIFKKIIETPLLNDLERHNLVKNGQINIKSPSVKRFIYHHTIYGLCEHILSLKGKEKIVIVHCEILSPVRQLRKFVDEEELQDFFNRFIVKIVKMFPIKFLITDITFSLIRKDIRQGSGESKNTIHSAKSIIDDFDITKYTFSKARYFANRYGLTFLSNNYFKKVCNKQLIFM